jgi:hypothetical protein
VTLYLIIPVYHYTENFVVKIDEEYWRNKDPVFPEDALILYTDFSRADSGAGAGIYGKRPERSFSFSLAKYATVFQTKIQWNLVALFPLPSFSRIYCLQDM